MFWRTLKLAIDNLRANKLRSFLTILGVVIGVVSVIFIAAIIAGLNAVVSSQVQSLGTNIVTVSRIPGFQGRLTDEERQRRELTMEDGAALRHEAKNVEMLTASLPLDFGKFPNPNISYGNVHAANVKVFGTEPDYISVYVSYVKSGRFITQPDVVHKTNVMVLGSTVANTMFPNVDPVGKTIKFENDSFEVIGVLEPRGSLFGFDRDNFVWLPISTMYKLHPESKYELQFSMRATSEAAMPLVKDQATEIMRRRRHVPFDKPNSFEVGSTNQFLEFYQNLTFGLYLAMIVIASIALMVAGIGVMNIMLVSVTERTREIGVRKAIGARPKDIRTQFLIEAMVLTGLGGVAGITIGEGISMLVDKFSPLPSRVPLEWIVLAFSVSVSVGLFFGIYPAARASKLDPIEALRYE